jgi:hypothetical protein
MKNSTNPSQAAPAQPSIKPNDVSELIASLESLYNQMAYGSESVAFHIAAVEHLENAVAIVGDGPPTEATDFQQEIIDLYKAMDSSGQKPVAVVGVPALETEQVETKISAAVTAMLVTNTLFAIEYSGNVLATGAKIFDYYASLTNKVRTRLELLRATALDETNPISDDEFEFGAYSRYFIHGGKAITSFDDYLYALDWQVTVSRYCVTRGKDYFINRSNNISNCLDRLNSGYFNGFEIELNAQLEDLENRWSDVWKYPKFMLPVRVPTPQPYLVVPVAYAAKTPMVTNSAIAPLLDSKYLIAYEPAQNSGGKDVFQKATKIRYYGATIVTDKSATVTAAKSLPAPTRAQLISAIERCLSTTADNESYKPLVKISNELSKHIAKTHRFLKNKIKTQASKEVFEYALLYAKLTIAIAENINKPFTTMAWSNMRASMMTIAIAEKALIFDEKKHFYSKGVFDKADSAAAEATADGAEKAQSFLDRLISYFR